VIFHSWASSHEVPSDAKYIGDHAESPRDSRFFLGEDINIIDEYLRICEKAARIGGQTIQDWEAIEAEACDDLLRRSRAEAFLIPAAGGAASESAELAALAVWGGKGCVRLPDGSVGASRAALARHRNAGEVEPGRTLGRGLAIPWHSSWSVVRRHLANAELLSLDIWLRHPLRSAGRLIPLRTKMKTNRLAGRPIFNLAFYMLHHRQDAEDATQEILVRVATGLSSFQRASAFRTWAHRIAVNHVLDRKRSRPETVVTGFDCYAEYLDRAPDEDFAGSERDSPETALFIQEASISCTMGMLLCLDRQQRMVFLLGEMLETNDGMGAELLGTSRENFRQLLARARAKLSGFMRGRCGLVDAKAACRCDRKTQAFVRDGIVNPKHIQFARGHMQRIDQGNDQDGKVCAQALAAFQRATLHDLRELYPWFEPPDVVARLRKAIESETAIALLDLKASGAAS